MKQLLTFFFVCLMASASAQHLSEADQSRWKEDFVYLKENMERVHINPYHRTDQKTFDQYISKVVNDLPSCNEDQALVSLVRMISMIGDGHTLVNFFANNPDKKFHCFPLRSYVFNDGLYVIGSSPEYSDLVGYKIIQVGNKKIDDCYKLIGDLPQHDNEYQVKQLFPFYLSIAELLHGTGMIASAEEARYVFETPQGKRIERMINATALPDFYFDQMRQPPSLEAPLYRLAPRKFYWYKYMPEFKMLYVAYNVIDIMPGHSLTHFCRELDSVVASSDVQKTVIDIRNNGGGDNGTCQPMVDFLSNNKKINRKGHLFTIIGRVTFSAASYFTTKMELNTQTIFVGEPTGASPNHYGDNRPLVLPHSKIEVRLSTVLWGNTVGSDNRLYTEADIPVDISSKDYFNLKDPVLDKIIALDPNSYESAEVGAGETSIITGQYLLSPLNTVTVYYEDEAVKMKISDVDHMGNEVSFIYATLKSARKTDDFLSSVRGLTFSYRAADTSLVMRFRGKDQVMMRKPADYPTPGKFFLQGKIKEGINLIRETYRVRPFYKGFNAMFLDGWSSSYIQRKNYPAAVAMYKFMTELYPYSIAAFSGLAKAQKLGGDEPGSLATYRAILRFDLENPTAKKALSL
jgi:hypothetical protein